VFSHWLEHLAAGVRREIRWVIKSPAVGMLIFGSCPAVPGLFHIFLIHRGPVLILGTSDVQTSHGS
jgi:hypothetical protein